MTNQRTGNASIIFHNHPLCLPTVLYVGSVPVNEHRLVRVCHFKHHRPCYKLVKELNQLNDYGNKPLERYALSWFISHNRLVTFFNYHLNVILKA